MFSNLPLDSFNSYLQLPADLRHFTLDQLRGSEESIYRVTWDTRISPTGPVLVTAWAAATPGCHSGEVQRHGFQLCELGQVTAPL